MIRRVGSSLLLVFAIGCGTGTETPSDAGRAITPEELEELENAREMIHQGNSADADEGLYKLAFTTTPANPAIGDNTFTLTVTTTAGAAFDGADVVAVIYGPDGQDSNQTPTTVAKGGGVYEISKVNFSKAGCWLVKFHITKGGTEESHDHAKFSVIVPERV